MKKVLVFSDSHGVYDSMQRIVQLEEPDVLFFLGDGLRDCAALEHIYPELPVYKVYGNCDIMPPKDVPAEIELEIEGHAVFLAHGHLYNVKTGLYEITREAKSRGAEIVLFGHTHRQLLDKSGELIICNPGSMSPSSGERYATIHFDETGIYVSLEEA